jgi:SHS family sialic acid transporter-like MFS transporter
MMLVAAAPALIVFFIMGFVPESERWKSSRRAGSNPLREIFAAGLRGRTFLGIGLASVALIGTWGSVQWLPLWADKLAGAGNPGAKADTQMWQALGAIAGAFVAPMLGAWMGRRLSYFFLCALSLVLCGVLFRTVNSFGVGFLAWAFVVSGATASFYGWFPLFFPELFPTRVRATAQGLCYNAGRILAAVGAMTQGQLVGYFGSYAQAGAVVTLIYVAGMAVIWLAPETKGQPLAD